MESYKGKIFSVKLENFVYVFWFPVIYVFVIVNFVLYSTYNSVSFYPSEYLNIIIGPNGTGKSTLVSAIVLGMGGNPKVLSRSSNVCTLFF